MVQIFETSDPRSKIGEMLGMGLGQGLSSGINSYFANKAIDDVVNDESLNGKPLSAKMGKLLSAVAPYGELGRQLFQDRFQIEQQAYNENQAKEQQKEALEKEQRLFAQQKELQGLKNAGKAEKATNPLDQAIPTEQIEAMEDVVANNPNASPTQLRLAFGKAGVNPRYYDKFIEDYSAENKSPEAVKERDEELGEGLKNALLGRNFDEDAAENEKKLFLNSTEGGRTAQFKRINKEIERKKSGKKLGTPQEVAEEMDFPPVEVDEGLTGEEAFRASQNRRKENLPHFNESQTQRRFLKHEANALSTLKNINYSNKLPKDLSTIVINPEDGSLRPYAQLAGFVNPETQLFVKTIYDFTTKAKDSFGARVTNFDLDLFMRRLPTLLNDGEGRALILEQMDLINQLNSEYENGLTKAYQKHGLGGIPYEKVVEQVENYISPKEEAITEKLRTILDRQDEIYSRFENAGGNKTSAQGNQKRPLSEIFK